MGDVPQGYQEEQEGQCAREEVGTEEDINS